MPRSRHDLEEELRRRIRDGVYQPGQRLPSHRELLRDLDASSATLQAAFDRLVEQGYVGERTARGSFVARNLPHRSTIGLVFPDDPSSRNWNRLYAATRRMAEEWNEGGTRFRVYGIARERLDSADHQRLCADLADGGLAGLVFVNSPFYLKKSPVMATTLPRVCINGNSARELAEFGHSLVNMVDGGIGERILERFRADGRRRFAALINLGGMKQFEGRYRALVHDAGFETRPAWWLGLPIDTVGAATARTVTALLLDGDRRERPDCLIIADDNLVPHATAGVLDAGVQAGLDILIAAHANMPAPTLAAVPCLRFGPDLAEQLRTALAELAALEAGGAPRMVEIPFELREAVPAAPQTDLR